MVGSDASTATHGTPRGPGSHLVARWVPNTLTPDDVFHFESASVLHDPLGNLFARCSRDLGSGEYAIDKKEP